MRHLIFLYPIFGLLLILTSCSYKQDQVLFEQKNSIPNRTLQKNPANITNYRIKPQDILQITNIQNSKSIIDVTAGTALAGAGSSASSQVAETYRVEDDGTVALTGLGRIPVAGLTRVEARKRIEELYGKFLIDPILELKIINLKVSVFGEVKAPGNFPLTKDRTTLIEVIGEAGGLTEKADETHIRIIHGDQENQKTDIIDLRNINSLTDPRTILQNNDVVYVLQNKKAIRNTKIQDFSVVIQPALILFNTALIIFTLVHK